MKLKIVLIIAPLLLIPFLCQRLVDGFSIRKVGYAEKGFQENGKLIPDLKRPFHYLGKGAQAFVFVSEDEQKVLKLFRKPRPHFRKATIKKRKNKQLKDFFSYQLAFEYLKEETGLEYIHLCPTKMLPTTTFYDKIGRKFTLNLNNYAFAVQKKAVPLLNKLEEWIEKNEVDKAKEGLTKLVGLLRTRIEKGIYDKDPDLRTNFGFVGFEPIQYDIGRFKMDETKEDTSTRLIRITDRLLKWLDKKSPELSEHIRTAI